MKRKALSFNIKSLYFLIFYFWFTQSNSFAEIIYVPQSLSSIQEGINYASEYDTVLVAPGTYYENINFNGKNIVVASYFLTTQDTGYIEQTIINGGNPQIHDNGSVVTAISGENEHALLCGFTLKNGTGTYIKPYADYEYRVYVGGGIYCANASPQFKNLIIDSNTVVDWGGGIFIMNSSSTFQDIQIINNTAGHSGGLMNWVGANTIFNNLDVRQNHAGHGGGMQIIESDPVLENANISYNTSNVGAGLYIGDANPLIINSFVQNNTSQSIAGGILFWNFGGEDNCPTLKNVLVTDNNSESGAGIYYEGIVNTKLINVTIANNTASGSGGGIYCYSTYLLNSIIWGNTPDQIDYFGPQDSVIIMYSDVSGGWNGLGNINADPLFKSVNDYHLSQGSPCINTGIPDTSGLSLPLYDIEGNERILYGRIDMGCYEYLNPLVIAENTNSVLHIFPNPVSDFININYLQPNSTVSIYDMMGKLAYYNHITTNQINVSEFTNGVYILKIETVKEIVTS